MTPVFFVLFGSLEGRPTDGHKVHTVFICFTAPKHISKAAQVYTLVPRPEPQVQPLQPGLCRVRSETSGRYYYYDPRTGVSSWDPW